MARKPRADAQRNQERLVEVARSAFIDVGPDVSLEEIARRAEVGIGTLYRHFPTREAIVAAVYEQAARQLSDAAPRLLEKAAPGDALRQWMRLFVDYIATKRIVAPALSAIVQKSGKKPSGGPRVSEALALLVERARAAGAIRSDVDAEDLFRALLGFTYLNQSPQWKASAQRLIEVLMDGLRT